MRLNPRTSTKLSTSMMLVYGAAGITIAGAVVFAIMFGVNMLKSEDALANNNFSSAKTGYWNENATWQGGQVPSFSGNNNSVTIESGNIIMFTNNANFSNHLNIVIKGTLIFYGNLSVGNHTNIQIQEGGLLLVYGNYSASNHLTVNNGGTVVLEGNVSFGNTNQTTITNNSDIYSADDDKNILKNSGKKPLTDMPPALALKVDNYRDQNFILPIELLHFTAESTQRGVQLRWATAAEINNDFFTLERTRDGRNYEKVSTISGAGNSKVQLNYDFTDTRPYSGTSYYRLTQTDYDGTSESFPLVTVMHNGLQGEMSIKISKGYPNPFQDQLTLSFFTESEGQTELTILNSRGDRVYSETILAYAGENEVIFKDGHRLPTDTYLVYLAQNGEQTKPYRVVKR
ncbi:MAG: hypothetical protein JJU28_21785 [Cyclobacteriaceae bacterium]|nr:hypothetical protein [Cyclobacteriaceae bacterium]